MPWALSQLSSMEFKIYTLKEGEERKNGFNRVIPKDIKVLRLKTQIRKQAGSVFVCA